jgi:hypothetical protein
VDRTRLQPPHPRLHARQRRGRRHLRAPFSIRADPALREELDYIVPRGIPYDAWAEWSPLSRGFALAWQRDKAATCSCGTRHDEWAADRDAYVGATHYCRGHDVLAMQQEALPKDDKGRPLPGFIAHLERREVAEAREAANTTRTD